MAFNGYSYGGYPATGGYYAPPVPDQLAQLRTGQMPMQQPMMQPLQPTQMSPANVAQPQPAITNNMIWVQGESGAKSFLIANGNTVPLWDSENQTIYIKTVDASGIPSMKILDYTERTQAPKSPVQAAQPAAVEYVTHAEFDALAAEIEALKNKKCACSQKEVKEDKDNA